MPTVRSVPALPARARLRLGEVARIAPGRPALLLGARTALATLAPLLIAPWIGPVAATWASTGGFTVALSDKGGAYRMRALTMGLVTLGATAAVALGALGASHALPAAALMLVWATLCAFAGVFGPAAAGGGTTVAVLFAISLAVPPASGAAVVERTLAVLASGSWAMVLALLFWPVRVYKPARFAVARGFRLLAAYASELERPSGSAGAPESIERAAHARGAIREALEQARYVLVATRRGRRGESGRGARLLSLLQIADLLFAALVQLEEVFESAVDAGLSPEARAAVRRALAASAASLRELAGRIEVEGRLPPASCAAPLAALRALTPAGDGSAPPARLHRAHAAALLSRLGEQLALAYEISASLYDDAPLGAPPSAALTDEPRSLFAIAREHLTPSSALFRHATRVGITAAVAVAVTRAFQLHRGYWVTLNVLILLQPYTPATTTKTLQRVLGTVLGGVLAALLVGHLHQRAPLIAIAAGLAGISAAVLQLNYALFSFFLTPTFVLLAEASVKDAHLVELRIVNTVLGAVLAFAGARLLWPHAERRRFPDELAAALRALRDYLEEMLRAVAAGAPLPSPSIRAARRRFGLAINRADTSFQRLLAEAGGHSPALEPIMTALLFARRASANIGAAGSARVVSGGAPTPQPLAPLAASLVAELEELEAAVRAARAPAAAPPLAELAARLPDALLAARFARLCQQLDVLHHALARWHPPPSQPA